MAEDDVRTRGNKVPAAQAADAHAGDDKFVTALARGLQILAAFDDDVELGNLELSQRTGMAPATISRLTHTLTVLGYLRRSPATRKYVASTGLLAPGIAMRKHLAVLGLARPCMEELARAADSTVILGARDGLSMLFLNVIRPVVTGLTVNKDTGSTVPLATTSAGMAYLVVAPLAERTRLLEELRAQYGREEWIAIRQDIERANESYRRDGFVLRIRSLSREVNSVSVPLYEGRSSGQYVFTCAGPVRAFHQRRLVEELGPQLVELARAVRARLAR